MGLFSRKPSGLGEKLTCSRCGRTAYKLEDNHAYSELLRNKYDLANMSQCASCGKYLCGSCAMRGCSCGGTRYITVMAMRKMG